MSLPNRQGNHVVGSAGSFGVPMGRVPFGQEMLKVDNTLLFLGSRSKIQERKTMILVAQSRKVTSDVADIIS